MLLCVVRGLGWRPRLSRTTCLGNGMHCHNASMPPPLTCCAVLLFICLSGNFIDIAPKRSIPFELISRKAGEGRTARQDTNGRRSV